MNIGWSLNQDHKTNLCLWEITSMLLTHTTRNLRSSPMAIASQPGGGGLTNSRASNTRCTTVCNPCISIGSVTPCHKCIVRITMHCPNAAPTIAHIWHRVPNCDPVFRKGISRIRRCKRAMAGACKGGNTPLNGGS